MFLMKIVENSSELMLVAKFAGTSEPSFSHLNSQWSAAGGHAADTRYSLPDFKWSRELEWRDLWLSCSDIRIHLITSAMELTCGTERLGNQKGDKEPEPTA